MSLFSAALLCTAAAASMGGRVSAAPRQVFIHNNDNEDVVVTITDLNTPNGVIIANQHPLDASADLALNANLDSHGAYNLHWSVQDPGMTRTQEGDCYGTQPFDCRVDLFTAP